MIVHPIWLFQGVGLYQGVSKDHFIPKSTVAPGKSWIYQTNFISCNSEIEMYLVKMIVHSIWLFQGIGLCKGMSKDHSIPKSTVIPRKIRIYQTDFISYESEIENNFVKKFVHPIRLLQDIALFQGRSKDHYIPISTVTPGKNWIHLTNLIICKGVFLQLRNEFEFPAIFL